MPEQKPVTSRPPRRAVRTAPWVQLPSRRHPLSAQALSVLEQLTAIRIDDQIFPGLKRDAMKYALAKLRPPSVATPHGMRGTFKSWAEDRTVHDWTAVEMALGHEVGSLVERSYRHTDMRGKRGSLMADWGRFCAGESEKENRIPG